MGVFDDFKHWTSWENPRRLPGRGTCAQLGRLVRHSRQMTKPNRLILLPTGFWSVRISPTWGVTLTFFLFLWVNSTLISNLILWKEPGLSIPLEWRSSQPSSMPLPHHHHSHQHHLVSMNSTPGLMQVLSLILYFIQSTPPWRDCYFLYLIGMQTESLSPQRSHLPVSISLAYTTTPLTTQGIKPGLLV